MPVDLWPTMAAPQNARVSHQSAGCEATPMQQWCAGQERMQCACHSGKVSAVKDIRNADTRLNLTLQEKHVPFGVEETQDILAVAQRKGREEKENY